MYMFAHFPFTCFQFFCWWGLSS